MSRATNWCRTVLFHTIHIPELSGREEVAGPFLYLIQRHVKPRTDDTTFVQTSIQVDNNLSRSMIVDYLKLTDVTYMYVGIKKKCCVFLFNTHHTHACASHKYTQAVHLIK